MPKSLLLISLFLLALPALAQPTKRTIRVRKEQGRDSIVKIFASPEMSEYARDTRFRPIPPKPPKQTKIRKYRYTSIKRDITWAKAYPDSVINLNVVLAFYDAEQDITDFNRFIREDAPRFKNLESLEISFTHITTAWDYDNDFFADLPKLASLPKLKHISLFNISEDFQKGTILFDALARLPQVRHISFSYSDINHFGDEFLKLKQVETLSIYNTSLAQCPESIFKMPYLKCLRIPLSESDLQDKRLPQAKHLKQLVVGHPASPFSLPNNFLASLKRILPKTEIPDYLEEE